MKGINLIAENWPALVTIGGVFTAIWALSQRSLKEIRDSANADSFTKDAAAAAIIGLSFVGSVGGSAVLGFAVAPNSGGALLGAAIFLIPFLAMCVIYFFRKRRAKNTGGKEPGKRVVQDSVDETAAAPTSGA